MWLRVHWEVISNLSAARCELVTIFRLDPNRSRRVLLKIRPPALLCSVSSANLQSLSVPAVELFIRLQTVAPTKQLRFPSTNVFLMAVPQLCGASQRAISVPMTILGLQTAANFSPSSMLNIPSRFLANCRAPCSLTPVIYCLPLRTLV